MDRLNWDGTPQGLGQTRPELAYTDEVKAATDAFAENGFCAGPYYSTNHYDR